MTTRALAAVLPAPERTLDHRAVEALPDAPGVYAAWITDEAALRQAGVEGPAPVLAYVGQARSLRQRIGRHVPGPEVRHRLPFSDLGELLATGGLTLWNWWARSFDRGPAGRWNVPSGLGQLAIDQTLAWQRENLVWGWSVEAPEILTMLEVSLIVEHEPLLNPQRRGVRAMPPQLRRIGANRHRRAQWLHLLSWTAAIRENWDSGTWHDGLMLFTPDRQGYPVVCDAQIPVEDEPVVVPAFDRTLVRDAMRRAGRGAHPAIARALETPPLDCELVNWWAAAWALGADLDEEESFELLLSPRAGGPTCGIDLDLPEDPRTTRELLALIEDSLG
jgi:hypothetical protein